MPLKTADDCVRALEYAVSLTERDPMRAWNVIAAVRSATQLLQAACVLQQPAFPVLAETVGLAKDHRILMGRGERTE